MLSPLHPSISNVGALKAGSLWDGSSCAGKFTEFTVEADSVSDAYHCRWTIDSTISERYRRVYIFLNGFYLTSVLNNYYKFVPSNPDQDRHDLEFFLGPNYSGYTEAHWTRTRNLANDVRLDWSLATGSISKVVIYKGSPDIDYDVAPIKTLIKPIIECDDDGVTVGGSWVVDEVSADLVGTCTLAGDTGDAMFSFAYNGKTKILTTSDKYQFVLNGVKIKFEEDFAWTLGDVVTIEIRLPHTYTVKNLTPGRYNFAVGVFNEVNLETVSAETEITIRTVPEQPTILSSLVNYVNGSGEITLTYALPADGVDVVRIYRNYPGIGINDIHYRPIIQDTISPGAIYQTTVTGLQEGRNLIVARVSNGEEEENVTYYSLTLNSSLNSITEPDPIIGIQYTIDENALVDFTINASSSGDVVNVYRNDGTSGGAIDWTTVWKTVANPQQGINQELSLSNQYFPDGVWKVGCRHLNGSVLETSTNIYTIFQINRTVAPKPTSLTATLVTV